MRFWKKALTLTLVFVMVLSTFAACGNTASTPETTVQTGPTEPAEEAAVLKVLTLGHSLAVDSGHMLAMIANAEGYSSMKVATLYYSGCPLDKHVRFMTENSPEYNLYVSSTDTPNTPPQILESVTMEQAIIYDYWDIIIMQGGVFEIAKPAKYQDGNIQKIQEYVNARKLNPLATFAWHMAWAPPVTNSLRDQYPKEPNTYYSNYEAYNDDRTALYQDIAKCVSDIIVPDETFEFVIPSGTVMENALSSYLEETDLHRDYVHATDLARVMVSYTWYCKLAGIEKLDAIKLDTIPKAMFKSTMSNEDRVLTAAEKDIILEAVNNALANPFQMTQSQYTTAPAA